MALTTTRRTLGIRTAAFVAGTVLPLMPARARALPAPTGAVLLSIGGKINASNDEDGLVHFDRAMLEKVGVVETLTTCPWYDGQVLFEGVPMNRLLDWVGARGSRVLATGHNQVAAELPREDLSRFGVMVATKLNGAVVEARNIGPLFVIYPYDAHPELKQQQYYERSLLQLSRLTIL